MYKAILALVVSSSVLATPCSQVGRAVVTDQKNMVYDVVFGYFNLNPSFIISTGTENYVSWKGEQVNCLADVYHYAEFKAEVKSSDPGTRCLYSVDLYVKDHFVGLTTGEREYKPRSEKIECFEESAEQLAQSTACAAAPKCPVSNDGIFIQDFSNDCKCILFDKVIETENRSSDYEDFFSPENQFPRPEGVLDLFVE